MNIKLKILISEIYENLEVDTAYIAASQSSSNNNLLQKSVTENNKEILDRYISNAYMDVLTLFSEYVKVTSPLDNRVEQIIKDKGELNITLLMPDNFNTNVIDSMIGGVHQYIVSRVLSKWVITVGLGNGDVLKSVVEDTNSALAIIRQAIFERKRPERRNYGIADNDSIENSDSVDSNENYVEDNANIWNGDIDESQDNKDNGTEYGEVEI